MARPHKIWFRQQTGWWMVKVNGKQVRLAKGRKNKPEAERAFHEFLLLQPTAPESTDARVADIVEAFLAWAKRSLSEAAYNGYLFYAQKFAERWGWLPVRDLKPYHVTRWVGERAWGPTSQYNGKRSAFRAFSWAIQEGLLAKNPLTGMRRPRPKHRTRCLTVDEYRALIAGAHGRFRVLLWALRQTGARPCEVNRLTWDEVRSDRWVLWDHKTVGKTEKPRVILLTPPMRRLMDRLRKDATSRFVFVNTRGKPWTTNAIRLQIGRIRRKLGLASDVCAYLFRHTYGTHAVLNGVNPSMVAELMGHSSLEMVSKVYVHLADQVSHLQEAAERAAQLPAPATPPATEKRLGAKTPSRQDTAA